MYVIMHLNRLLESVYIVGTTIASNDCLRMNTIAKPFAVVSHDNIRVLFADVTHHKTSPMIVVIEYLKQLSFFVLTVEYKVVDDRPENVNSKSLIS